jgi:hypothetical protein
MELGDILIRSSIRLAMICYAAVLFGCALDGRAPATTPASRWLWTIGCVLYGGHVLSAFAFYHHWSHAHAFDDVAEQTKQTLGVEFGYGLYVNHLFTVVWTADVIWSWISPNSYAARPRSIVFAVQGFLLFIAVNGLVVFKAGTLRWVSLGVLVCIAGIWTTRWVRTGRTSLSQSGDEAARS